jgi:hypothetical protein
VACQRDGKSERVEEGVFDSAHGECPRPWLPSRLSRNNVLAHSTAVPLHQPKPLVHLQHAVLLEYAVASECFFFRKPTR